MHLYERLNKSLVTTSIQTRSFFSHGKPLNARTNWYDSMETNRKGPEETVTERFAQLLAGGPVPTPSPYFPTPDIEEERSLDGPKGRERGGKRRSLSDSHNYWLEPWSTWTYLCLLSPP